MHKIMAVVPLMMELNAGRYFTNSGMCAAFGNCERTTMVRNTNAETKIIIRKTFFSEFRGCLIFYQKQR